MQHIRRLKRYGELLVLDSFVRATIIGVVPNKVSFMKVGGDDPGTETFLRQWLDDVVAIEESDEDASVLKFPPLLPGSRV